MRGASALGRLLAAHPAAPVRVLVVWEPVIDSDVGPPSDAVRAPLNDPRVIEYWDAGLWLSPRVIDRALAMAAAAGRPAPVTKDDVAWDFIALFPAGVTWQEPFPEPAWQGYPIVKTLGPVEEALGRMAADSIIAP